MLSVKEGVLYQCFQAHKVIDSRAITPEATLERGEEPPRLKISPTQTMERIPSALAASFFEEEVEEGTSIPADIAGAFFAEDLLEGPSSPPPPPPTPPAKTSPLLLVAGPSGTCPWGQPLTADEKRGVRLPATNQQVPALPSGKVVAKLMAMDAQRGRGG
ncbi:uncharacterized protein LOC134545093 [Bacillus rossius redtenbacheri]|uniref:uncharacterized protein LOC134545093 n=1 Tax=Bacillus rossius redtenbacheri TaxID=93214 RepID=UPI002FDD8DB6